MSIEQVQSELRRTIARHYGAKYVDEVLSMIQVGSTSYCDEVMQAYHTARSEIFSILTTQG